MMVRCAVTRGMTYRLHEVAVDFGKAMKTGKQPSSQRNEIYLKLSPHAIADAGAAMRTKNVPHRVKIVFT